MDTYKTRTPLHQTLSFLYLLNRYPFHNDFTERHKKIAQGWYGEYLSDIWLKEFFNGYAGQYLCDLRLNIDYQQIQVDSLLVLEDTVIVFEVKNLNFNLSYRDKKFYFTNGEPFTHLNNQLKKLETLIGKLIASYDPAISVIVYPFFVNTEQRIDGIMLDGDVLVAGNYKQVLDKYLYHGAGSRELEIADYIFSKNVVNDFDKKLEIEYSLVDKGIYCPACYKKLERETLRIFNCNKCVRKFSTAELLDSSIAQIQHLWSDKPITTRLLYEWIGEEINLRTIQRYVKKYHEIIDNVHNGRTCIKHNK